MRAKAAAAIVMSTKPRSRPCRHEAEMFRGIATPSWISTEFGRISTLALRLHSHRIQTYIHNSMMDLRTIESGTWSRLAEKST